MSSPFNFWRKFLAMPNDSSATAIIVAVMVALICSLLVSVTSVTLRPLQIANLDRERQLLMDEMLATLPDMRALMLEAGVDALESQIVDLASGEFTTDIDLASYDPRAAANDPSLSAEIAPDADIAGLKRRANYMPVYLLRRDDELELLVLPIHGAGYQSTIYAYLALQKDLNTIAALTIYEQGETPGLGARITDTEWQALWAGKALADENGEILINVVRGKSSGPFEVDGITGATRTSNGISNLLKFWLGQDGFGPFLDRLKIQDL